MGEFNTKIVAEFTPPKTWVLEKALSFQTDQLNDEDIQLLKIIGVNKRETFLQHLFDRKPFTDQTLP